MYRYAKQTGARSMPSSPLSIIIHEISSNNRRRSFPYYQRNISTIYAIVNRKRVILDYHGGRYIYIAFQYLVASSNFLPKIVRLINFERRYNLRFREFRESRGNELETKPKNTGRVLPGTGLGRVKGSLHKQDYTC